MVLVEPDGCNMSDEEVRISREPCIRDSIGVRSIRGGQEVGFQRNLRRCVSPPRLFSVWLVSDRCFDLRPQTVPIVLELDRVQTGNERAIEVTEAVRFALP
jgi:hypothetical protein